MSDQKTILYCNFINRRTGQKISQVPIPNRLNLNIDATQFADAFDFDILFKFSDDVDLRSHDFIEVYFKLDGQDFQVFAGFLEDFVSETSDSTLRVQANGRCFLGQLMSLPFLKANPIALTSMISFCQKVVDQSLTIGGDGSGTYLKEYLKLKGITRTVVDLGAYRGGLTVPELSDAKIAPVMQSLAEEVNNIIYQNRFGQMIVWGRDLNGVSKANLSTNRTGLTLTDAKDVNVNGFQLRQNYSKVVSECKIMIVSGEGNLDYAATLSGVVANTEPRAKQIFQPEVRTFNTSSLITTQGAIGPDQLRNRLAASIVRKSNRNLYPVVIKTNQPYYIESTGKKTPYEVNQLWNIKSEKHKLSEEMRLSGINYRQDANGLQLELMFIPKDSLC